MADRDPPRTKTEAQRRADRIRAFRDELSDARREGALDLTPEQAARLTSYHDALLARLAGEFDVDVSPSQRRASLGMRLATIVGALALGASVVFLFFRVWGHLPVAVQVSALVAATLLALAGLEAVSRHAALRFASGFLAFVAFAAFVLDLEVLGRLFALSPTPLALLAYGLFAVALAYAHDHRLLLAAGAVCLAGWLAATIVQMTGAWWIATPERPESVLAAGAGLVAWGQVPHPTRDRFPAFLRGIGLFLTLSSVLVLGRAGALSWLPADARAVEATYQVLGFPLAAALVAVGIRRDWPETTGVASFFFFVFMVVKLADWWWEWMPRYLFFLILGLVSFALTWLFRRVRAGLARA